MEGWGAKHGEMTSCPNNNSKSNNRNYRQVPEKGIAIH
jgi:hypothetical protein